MPKDAASPTKPIRKAKVNNARLAGLIIDTKRRNERLDRQELASAQRQFDKFQKGGVKVHNLSHFLNYSQESLNGRDDYFLQELKGEYVRIYKRYCCGLPDCQMKFAFSQELVQHLKAHKK